MPAIRNAYRGHNPAPVYVARPQAVVAAETAARIREREWQRLRDMVHELPSRLAFARRFDVPYMSVTRAYNTGQLTPQLRAIVTGETIERRDHAYVTGRVLEMHARGVDFGDIADALGISRRSARDRVYRARAR